MSCNGATTNPTGRFQPGSSRSLRPNIRGRFAASLFGRWAIPTLTRRPPAMRSVGLSPDTGTGGELYAVIGHSPRHLDRNIAVVGRVIDGIERMSSLPRGTEALGFYKEPSQHVPIARVRLASQLQEAERPQFQYLSTASAAFGNYVRARANRRDNFFIRPAGGVDLCNAPVPVRRKPAP